MPELPEVETVRLGLAPVLEGATIAKAIIRRSGLRFPFPPRFAGRLQGQQVLALSRRAKYLLADLANGEVLVMHLGMSGSFRIHESGSDVAQGLLCRPPLKLGDHDHVVLEMARGQTRHRIVYNDPRRFGYMDLIRRERLDVHPLFMGLGIEPTGNQLDAKAIARLFAGKAAPLKAALLDQRLIAGLGNIYACEALWQAGLSPRRAAGSIVKRGGGGTPRTERLANSIRDVVARAIAAGGASLRDHRQTDGQPGNFQHDFRVYGRAGEPCMRPGCDGRVRRIVQSGRSTFWCPTCQR